MKESTHSAASVKDGAGIKVTRSCTVLRDHDELYRFWRNFQNLPRIMTNLISVVETSGTRSHWVVKGPAGSTVEWDAEVINETPGELIAWRTVENPTVDHAGSVRFQPAPGGRGTEVKVTLEYHPPGGKLGDLGAKLFGIDPADQVTEDLLRFKALMETGEIPTTKGQPLGAGKGVRS